MMNACAGLGPAVSAPHAGGAPHLKHSPCPSSYSYSSILFCAPRRAGACAAVLRDSDLNWPQTSVGQPVRQHTLMDADGVATKGGILSVCQSHAGTIWPLHDAPSPLTAGGSASSPQWQWTVAGLTLGSASPLQGHPPT